MSQLPTEPAPAQKAAEGRKLYSEHQPAKASHHRTVVWSVVVLFALGLSYIAYRSRVDSAGIQGAGGRGRGGFGMSGPMPVVARAASKADVNVVLKALGTVTPLATVTIRTQIPGYLYQVNFTEGQMVKKGDVLAVIDPRPYEAALSQAQGQLLQAQAQLREAQLDLERYTTLVTQDSISKQQVDVQRALVQQYEGLTKTDQAAVDNATLNLAYCHVTAPCDGRVGLRLVDQGNYVTPGDSTGLVLLTQLKPISVIFPAAEDNIPAVLKRLRDGTKISVDAYSRDDSAKLASGSLTTVDNAVDPTTGQFKMRATFPNDDEALFPSQFVVVHMLLDIDKGVTVIPTSAVERGQQGSFVYVVGADSTVTAKSVTLGDSEGERVAVTSGIAVGDRVVVDGADRLKDGMAVLVQDSQGGKPRGSGAGAPSGGWGRSQNGAPRPSKQGGGN
jgi:multidrug efflux system membrane fusion protein